MSKSKILLQSLMFFIGCQFSMINAIAQETHLVQFKIKDQFNREFTEKSWGDSILVLIGSDRDGSVYNEGWGAAINDSLASYPGGETIHFVPHADIRGAPFFVKGFIRGKFPKEREKWVMMDWKGVFSKAYQFVKGESNILVFDRQRKLVHQTSGKEVTPAALGGILAALKGILMVDN